MIVFHVFMLNKLVSRESNYA